MDLWVVGAAAAAGYIAKYWQNLSKDRANSLELSSGTSTCEKPETSSSPFHKLIRRRKQVEDTLTNGRHFSDGGFSDMYQLDGASDTEAASTSSFDDNSGNPCTVEMNSYYCSGKSSLRTKHSGSHVVKPLSSLDSCLMAQLYREHARTEEYVLSALQSPSTIMKPLLITDGTQIISRADRDSLSAQNANDNNRWHKEEIVCGVPPLPKIGFSDHLKKIKSKRGKGQNERSSSSQKHLQSLNGILLIVNSCLPCETNASWMKNA
ncbi:hypothetical protein OIU84_008171 [Salix udensis]|uniref:Uncharacterized protein n=1 Tax=Salix udensis TaxID=889485 RepID=A0AAD6NZX3_9ROSI|nr:hypothetical protein OIU84_008171 [Salix udensis]